MAGHHKWSELREKMSPEARGAADRKTRILLADMALPELREARGLTQEQLAERLGIRQSNVSAMERRLDMHVSTLRHLVEALGGELEIAARFPDGVVRISQFEGMAGPSTKRAAS